MLFITIGGVLVLIVAVFSPLLLPPDEKNSNHEVVMLDDDKADFYVKFHGPKDTAYEGGVWKACPRRCSIAFSLQYKT